MAFLFRFGVWTTRFLIIHTLKLGFWCPQFLCQSCHNGSFAHTDNSQFLPAGYFHLLGKVPPFCSTLWPRKVRASVIFIVNTAPNLSRGGGIFFFLSVVSRDFLYLEITEYLSWLHRKDSPHAQLKNHCCFFSDLNRETRNIFFSSKMSVVSQSVVSQS